MKEKTYRESVELVLSRVLMSSSNVRSVSLIAATGVLRRFKLRDDVNLLLNPNEMGELVSASRGAASLFYKHSRKMGDLRYMHLDFENVQMLIFPMPDRNLLMITLEKAESDVPIIVSFIQRLLQREGLVHAR